MDQASPKWLTERNEEFQKNHKYFSNDIQHNKTTHRNSAISQPSPNKTFE